MKKSYQDKLTEPPKKKKSKRGWRKVGLYPVTIFWLVGVIGFSWYTFTNQDNPTFLVFFMSLFGLTVGHNYVSEVRKQINKE